MDSIRQCEGVAKLLQNSTGKEVAVKPAKTNKVTPGELLFWGLFVLLFLNSKILR